MSKKKLRLLFTATATVLLVAEICIAFYAEGWIRNYLGDVLIVALLYAVFRAIIIDRPSKWFVLPTIFLVLAFGVEFLQLWGIWRHLGISNRYALILMGASFSVEDLVCYAVGSIPCYLIEYTVVKKLK